jgi:hypothetical protein
MCAIRFGYIFCRRVGGLGGFLAGQEGIDLSYQPSADRSYPLFPGRQVRVLPSQLGELPGGVALVRALAPRGLGLAAGRRATLPKAGCLDWEPRGAGLGVLGRDGQGRAALCISDLQHRRRKGRGVSVHDCTVPWR